MSQFNKVQPVRKPTRPMIIATLPKAIQPYACSLDNHQFGKARRRADILGIPFETLLFHESQGRKYCTRCYEPKPATTEYFYPKQSGRDGLCSVCKPCEMLNRAPRVSPVAPKPIVPEPQEPVGVRRLRDYQPPPAAGTSGRTVRYDPALHNAGHKKHGVNYTPLDQLYDRRK